MPGERRKPFIVPVFLPNRGCPHRCAFCEQEKITGEREDVVDGPRVSRIIERSIRSRRYDPGQAEVAFYGGTFTNLDLRVIEELLGAVSPFLKKGLFTGIRVSTRPDCLDPEKLDVMMRGGVKTVELGVQSMDDRVLLLSGRGHSAQDSEHAVTVLKQFGFQVGVQLMPGLPGDSKTVFLSTVERIIGLAPDMARLYPSLVIQRTGLADLYARGAYLPLELSEAVEICAESCMMLERAGIPVIRIGLMSSPSLTRKGQILGGPWHPAFGFLVRCRMYQKSIASQLPAHGTTKRLKIRVRECDVPLLRGYKNHGMEWISMVTGAEELEITGDRSISPGKLEVSWK